MNNKELISVSQLARMLGISRIAVFKKIKNGQIKAIKIGRAYAISHDYSPTKTSPASQQLIERAVAKTVKEYGETLKLLGKE